jgi:hypothetical protein
MFIIVGNVWKKHVVTSRAPTLVCMLEPARGLQNYRCLHSVLRDCDATGLRGIFERSSNNVILYISEDF